MLSRSLQIGAGFVLVVAVARYLSIEDYGEYSFIITFASSITALTYFGIQQVVIREIAKDLSNAPHYLGVAVKLRAVISLLVIAIFLIAMLFVDVTPAVMAAITIAMISEILLSFNMLLKAVFQAFERMVYEPVLTLVFYVILAGGLAAVMLLKLGYLWIFVSMAAANLIQLFMAAYVMSSRFVRPSFKTDRKIFIDFFKYTAVVGLGIFLYQNLLKINVLMLKWLSGTAEVALFQVPHNLIIQLQILPASLISAIYPVLSRSFHDGVSGASGIYVKTFGYLFMFSCLAAVCFTSYAEEIIILIFGKKFMGSVLPMKIMAWAFIPFSLDILLNSVLIAINKQKYSVIYGGAALAANFLAAFAVLPYYSYIGASVLAVMSYSMLFFCSLYFVSRNGLPSVIGGQTLKTVLATALTLGFMLTLKRFSVFLALPAGVAFYVAVIFVFGGFSAEDITFFKRALRKRPAPGGFR